MRVVTDEGTGIAYVEGKCRGCKTLFMLKFHKAEGKYKCPKCKQIFILRRQK